MKLLPKILALYRARELLQGAGARFQCFCIWIQILWLRSLLLTPVKIRLGWMRIMRSRGYAFRFESRTDLGKVLVHYLRREDRIPWRGLGTDTGLGLVIHEEIVTL